MRGPDVTLAGLLADGSAFSFDLNTELTPGQDFFPPSSILTVTIVFPGDYNFDGIVGAADYVTWRSGSSLNSSVDGYNTWRSSFGARHPSAGVPGDYNADLIVNAADYVVWRDGGSPDSSVAGFNAWRNSFGAMAVGSVASSRSPSVPEPAVPILASAGVLGLLARRRYDRRVASLRNGARIRLSPNDRFT